MFLERLKAFVLNRPALMLLAVGHLPFVVLYFKGLYNHQAHYQFFPFAIGAFIALALFRRRDVPEQWTGISLACLGLDLLCVIAGLVAYSPWLITVGLFFLTLAWCMASEEEGYSRRLTYLALLPLLTIRLPVNGDVQVIQMLQTITTKVASKSLQRFGFLHVRSGNVLDFPDKRFLVEEACSGVQSLFTILFIAALVICVKRRAIAHGLVLLASGILFAGIMNVMRVISIAVAWDKYGMDLSTGWRHDMLGYASLSVAALLLMSADSFLAFITDPVPDVRRPGPVAMFRNPFVAAWNRLFSVMPKPAEPTSASVAEGSSVGVLNKKSWVGAAAGLCSLLLLVQGYALMADHSPSMPAGQSSLTLLGEDSLPVEISGFVRGDYTTETRETGGDFGEFSNIWKYSGNGVPVQVSCDHPFFGWHPLQQCYISQGWQINETTSQAYADKWEAVIVRMSLPAQGQHGVLIYSLFDRSGRPMQPQGLSNPGEMLMDRLFRNENTGLLDPVAYQSQVFVSTAVPLDAGRLKELVELHFQARGTMKTTITGQLNQ